MGPTGPQGPQGASGQPADMSNYYTKSEIDASLGVCVTSTDIKTIVVMTQSAYDQITPDASTFYLIK